MVVVELEVVDVVVVVVEVELLVLLEVGGVGWQTEMLTVDPGPTSVLAAGL